MTWQPPQYGVRGRENCWINSLMQSHDTFCGCNDPILHLMKTAINRGGIFSFNQEKAKELLQCRPTTTDQETNTGETDGEGGDTGPEGDLFFGELEKLFEDDNPFTDENTG